MHGSYVIILAFALNIYPVAASPVQPHNLEWLEARANSDNNQLISPKAWIPIVVVTIMLCIAGLMTWSRGYFQKAIEVFGEVYGTTHTTVPMGNNSIGARAELTAEQLVGSINGTDLPTSGAPRHTRRTRRPRRTPSQVSITSLPAYNKEPGEEELVIFRGRDVEDATMPAATVASPANEDDSLNSQDHSQVSRYSLMPTASNDIPLLHNDDPSGDLSLQSLWSPDVRRPSFDSSLQETSSLMRVDSNLPQSSSVLRGEAPPYFEVVDHTPNFNSGVPTTQRSSMPSSASPESQRRRSGFRTFLNRMSMMSHALEHRRMESNQSVSTSNSHRRERSTLSMFRTISDQRSNQTLNSSVRLDSPSLISLNSISLPLSHTLIRTEFTYPKSGPTPEQLRVISSRENFSRFGVPYGPDAIAFAASSSRQDLEPPPPDFEALSSELSLLRPGPSRLDSSGNAADAQEGRPSISEPTSGGEGAEHGGATHSSQPPAVDMQSENVVNTSTISITHTHAESSASPTTSKVPNLISPIEPSSSTSTRILPPVLPPINIVSEFGDLHHLSISLTPQDATGSTARSESRTSYYSFQSYATASDSLGRERVGYIGIDSGPSTPNLGDRHVVG